MLHDSRFGNNQPSITRGYKNTYKSTIPSLPRNKWVYILATYDQSKNIGKLYVKYDKKE
jgi:hypothetical protein